jgi:threonine-phosphate decarboxylase
MTDHSPDSVFDHGGTIHGTARALGCAVEELLDFSASINPLGLSPAVRGALMQAIEQIPHYPDAAATALTEALAASHQLPCETIVPANGSTSLIHLLPAICAGRGGMIICPAFSEYERALQRHGHGMKRHLLSADDRFALDLERLATDLQRERPGLLFFCTPSNPAGVLYDAAQVRAVLELCRKNGTLLVLDEAFMDFCGEEHSAKQAVVASGQGIVLRSLTKFHALAGLRLGCALAAPELAGRIRAAQPPWEVNNLAQAAGVAALADTRFAAETRRLIADNRAQLSEQLSRLPGVGVFPSAVNYLLLRLSGSTDVPQLQERLLRKHRIMVRNCGSFAGLGDRFLRVAVRSREENERLVQALKAEFRF